MIMEITWLHKKRRGGDATKSIQVSVCVVLYVFQNPTISHIGGENE
jgi:hypothetical protein